MASDNRAAALRQTKNKKKPPVTPPASDVLPPDAQIPPPPVPENGSEPPAQDVLTDAVIIRVIRQENGGVNTAINIMGDVRVTEIESLLRIAQKTFLNDIGE